MREEYELEVLEQYDLEVKSTRKIRGAFFCDTDEGPVLLRETGMSEQRALFLYQVLNCLETDGNIKTDTPVHTKSGELTAAAPDGRRYMLKKWHYGRECDVRQESEAVQAARQLAVLHAGLSGEKVREIAADASAPVSPARDPLEEIRRHNRELKKVRRFIRGRAVKNEFEYLFLESFEKMYRTAEQTAARMEESGIPAFFRESVRGGHLLHGEYNYHNLLTDGDGIAVTNFEHMKTGIQVYDLYYFIRKVMEKYSWKLKTGQKLLEAYEDVRPLTQPEREYAGLMLAYPEKYWKTASGYYHSNKAWMPEKNREKLRLVLRQCEGKKEFLDQIFSIDI